MKIVKLSLVGHTGSPVLSLLTKLSMCMSIAFVVSTVRVVLMHLDESFDVHVKWHLLSVGCVCVDVTLGVGRQDLQSPSLSTISSSSGATSILVPSSLALCARFVSDEMLCMAGTSAGN